MERRGLNIRKGFLRAVLPMIRALPLPVASRFVSGIGRMEYRLEQAPARPASDEAVAPRPVDPRLPVGRAAVSRELAGNHVLWRTRDLLLDGVPDDRARDDVHRDRAREPRRGRRPGARLHRAGEPLRCASAAGALAVPRELPGSVLHGASAAHFAVSCRGISRPTARSARTSCSSRGRACRPIRPARSSAPPGRIKAGMLLYLAGDVRWTGQLTETAQFLGRDDAILDDLGRSGRDDRGAGRDGLLPDGARRPLPHRVSARLPRAQGCRRTKDEAGRWVRHFIEILEDQVRRYPTNSNDYFFWEDQTVWSRRPSVLSAGLGRPAETRRKGD